jgi:hypothetical protein
VNFRLGGHKNATFCLVWKKCHIAQKTHFLIISNFHEQAKFVTVHTEIFKCDCVNYTQKSNSHFVDQRKNYKNLKVNILLAVTRNLLLPDFHQRNHLDLEEPFSLFPLLFLLCHQDVLMVFLLVVGIACSDSCVFVGYYTVQ